MGSRNCWTCVHDMRMGESGMHYCGGLTAGAMVWMATLDCVEGPDHMPPRETPPCPGWEAKERDDD